MRKQYIAISVLTAVLILAWIGKTHFFPNLSADWAYLYWITVSLCAIVVLLLSVHCLIEGRKKPTAHPGPIIAKDASNRRNSFRVTYPDILRPTLFVEQVDGKAKRHLEFPIVDISEEGICFIDDGSLGNARMATGRFVFKNGEKIAVRLEVVRRQGYRISAHLKHSLPWGTLIREQRKILYHKRNA